VVDRVDGRGSTHGRGSTAVVVSVRMVVVGGRGGGWVAEAARVLSEPGQNYLPWRQGQGLWGSMTC
jgi:hypothetical protein